jgi:hypothetical protein
MSRAFYRYVRCVSLITTALLLAVICPRFAPGQQTTETYPTQSQAKVNSLVHSSVEEWIAAALKYNPDIRLADVKLRNDEAELNRLRLRILQKLVALHHAIDAQQAEVNLAEGKWKRTQELVRREAVQPALLEEAKQEMLRARAKLAETEAELPTLIGASTRLGQEIIRTEVQIGPNRSGASRIRPAVAKKISHLLNQTVAVDYEEQPLGNVLKKLREQSQGVAIQQSLVLQDLSGLKINLRLGDVPLGDALYALQDTVPGLRVVIRDYGILITWEHEVPLGAVRLYDFWRGEGVSVPARTVGSRGAR